MKGKEWLKKQVKNTYRLPPGYTRSEWMLHLIDQMDEPDEREQLENAYEDILGRKEFEFDGKEYVVVEKSETLSQKWIEKNVIVHEKMGAIREVVPVSSLQNLIADEPELHSKEWHELIHKQLKDYSALTDKSFDFYWNAIANDIEFDNLINVARENEVIVTKPETLPQEWLGRKINDVIDYYYEYPFINQHAKNMIDEIKSYIKQAEQLENQVVIDIPEIPQFAADWIEECKGWNDYEQEYDEDNAIGLFSAMDLDDASMSDEVHDYLVGNTETLIIAWLYGYTIKEEPKYYVINKENELLLSKNIEGDVITYSQDYEQAKRILSDLGHYQFTEQEIKDYDKRYWTFAKPVDSHDE